VGLSLKLPNVLKSIAAGTVLRPQNMEGQIRVGVINERKVG